MLVVTPNPYNLQDRVQTLMFWGITLRPFLSPCSLPCHLFINPQPAKFLKRLSFAERETITNSEKLGMLGQSFLEALSRRQIEGLHSSMASSLKIPQLFPVLNPKVTQSPAFLFSTCTEVWFPWMESRGLLLSTGTFGSNNSNESSDCKVYNG